jgi:hypothetical protein
LFFLLSIVEWINLDHKFGFLFLIRKNLYIRSFIYSFFFWDYYYCCSYYHKCKKEKNLGDILLADVFLLFSRSTALDDVIFMMILSLLLLQKEIHRDTIANLSSLSCCYEKEKEERGGGEENLYVHVYV